jgi:hypothetical protein
MTDLGLLVHLQLREPALGLQRAHGRALGPDHAPDLRQHAGKVAVNNKGEHFAIIISPSKVR